MSIKYEKILRDNVHGDIIFKDPIFLEIINTKEFQRLRRIIQLGGGQYVFSAANHSRFSHCVGVYHVLNKFLSNENLSSELNDQEKLVVKLAGLLHDIGHGPFSHSFEKISVQSHETYTSQIITGDTEVNAVLKKYNVDPEEVASIIDGKHPKEILNLLVSSQLDADRLDYLLRDGLGAGVNYSNVDIDWILRHAKIIKGKIAYPTKTIQAIEAYLLGRYHMYQQVYTHKVSESFDIMLTVWFSRLQDLYNEGFKFKHVDVIDELKELIEGKVIPTDKYVQLDDYTMLEFLKRMSKEDDNILADLSSRIINRNFFIVKKGLSEGEIKQKLEKSGFNVKYYMKEIVKKDFNMYNVKVKSKDENIYIFDDNDNLQTLNQVSQIINVNVKDEESNGIFIFPKEAM